jgi:hypothetical protein
MGVKKWWGLSLLFLITFSACVQPDTNLLSSSENLILNPTSNPSTDLSTQNPAENPTLTPTPQDPLYPSPTPLPPFQIVATSSSSVIGLQNIPSNIDPLTGLAVEDPSILNRRPVMIKVSNYPRSGRPHSGLSFADIVFEYYIGEESNRFLALFYGQDAPRIGPIRSGRLVDPQLVEMYGGFLVYGGADMKVETVIVNVLDDRAITHITTPCPPICGTETHSIAGVFANSSQVTDYIVERGADNSRPDLTGMVFDSNIPTSDQTANQIGVEYSFRDRGEWHYDAATGKYLRWIEADDNYTMIPLIDRITEQQIAFSNVIIIFTTYIEYAPTLHDILVWNNDSGERAVMFRDGIMVEGTWKVPDHNHPIQFYNKYGLPAPLKPGNTWIIIAGLSTSFEEAGPGNWEMHFSLP